MGARSLTLRVVGRSTLTARALSGAGRLAQAALWVPVGHLAAVAVAGSLRPRQVTTGDPHHRFVIVVPARNEESQIHMPVTSALQAEYPADMRRVLVVADNCTDGTAAEAKEHGAEVWERFDTERASKGAAVEWALERLLPEDGWDAVVFLDADAQVDPRFLAVVDQRLAEGLAVVQGERHVTNADDNVVSRLAQVSSAAQCVLRPRGRARLGGAAKLVGNGMVIHRRISEVCPWRAEGLVEDVEYWLQLLEHGIHPVHEPCAVVSDLMPTDLAAARVQRSRWEAGRFNLLGDHLRRCAGHALRRRDPVMAEALISELILPNLSVTQALVLTAGLARWATARTGAWTAAAQSGVIAGHVVLSLRAAGADRSSYAALALAPGVMVWRVWVTVEAALKRRRLRWHSTPRGVRPAA